ncbi:MAG: phosphoglycerate dehydrogenase [Candidatus Omnitrophota bacterium]|nr:phosphoglycerate dehydrogenase [Candidatus Omnitrophota bacterium]
MESDIKEVLISTTTFAEFDRTPLDCMEKKGLSYKLNPYGRKLNAGEVIELGKNAIGIVAGTEPFTNDVLLHLPKLRVISRCGSGTDNIDLESADKKGIKVYNTRGIPSRAVAELTVGVLLNLLRKITQMDRLVREGKWEKKMGALLYGKKVGIIGFGSVGQKVCELLSAFGAELSYCDIEPKDCSFTCAHKTFEEILKWADIVTLHLSLSKNCKCIIGNAEIELMKKGILIINLSRGGMVDEQALYNALKNGHISGAALDVFEHEPYEGPLRALDNIILTPHVGSYAKETRIEMETEAVSNLLKGFGVLR